MMVSEGGGGGRGGGGFVDGEAHGEEEEVQDVQEAEKE